MTLGTRLRQLRKAKRLTLRQLAQRVGVGFTYLSKIENDKLESGHAPSQRLIHMLADELQADEDELLLLAEKVPESIRRRVLEHPDAFRAIAKLDDQSLRRLLHQLIG